MCVCVCIPLGVGAAVVVESVYRYVVGELSRGYLVERDEAMFSEKQRRVNTFMKTPRELEKVSHTMS